MKLGELELMTGFQGKESDGEEYYIINISDINKHGLFDYTKLNSSTFKNVNNKYKLRKNDLIIKARGADTTVTIIDKDYENLLVVSHFIIVRIKEGVSLDPYYLLMYLNSFKVKEIFSERLLGTKQKILKIKTIDNLNIPEISEENQKKLGEIMKKGILEKVKLDEYVRLREKEINAKLDSILKEEESYEEK